MAVPEARASWLHGRGEAGCKRVRVGVYKHAPPSAPRSPSAATPPPPAAPPPSAAAPPPQPAPPPPQPAEPRRRRLADGSPPGAEPAGAAAVRFLTYDWYGSCGGLGDYLIGLVSLFPAALLDRRALLVAQPCMHAAFRSPHIDTALSPDVPMGGRRPLLRATPPPLDAASDGDEPQRVEWLAPPCERLEGNLGAAAEVRRDSNSSSSSSSSGDNSSAVPCLDLLRHTFEMEALQQLSALSNYRVRYNKGMLITTLLRDQGLWANALRQLGFKVAYGFGCILRFLFSPRPEVWQLLVGMEEQAWGEGVVRVAVHVRVPDREVWQNDGMTPQNMTQQQLDDLLAKASSTLQCAQAVEDFWYPPPLKVKWVLITNSHLLKQALKAKYPHKVMATDFIPWHSAQATEHEQHTDLASPDERDAALRGLQHFRETVAEWALIASHRNMSVTRCCVVHSCSPPAPLVHSPPCQVVATDFIPWHSAQATQHEQHTDLESSSSSAERDAALQGLQHFRETVAEWALIASSHSFIIPASGFSRTAALYALRPLDIYVPPPLNPPKAAENAQKPPPPPSACDPEKPTAIDRFGVTWSGI
ncbi:unnamed protein product [Closterium sp. Naga37s-1]|nr:unnamed protein product [Closterium sp. Naga37s-1]